MSTVKVGENESLDSAIRRFKRKCARDGIIGDLRKREAYEKPSVSARRRQRQRASVCIRRNAYAVWRENIFAVKMKRFRRISSASIFLL